MADTMYIKIGQKIRVTQPSVSIGELGDLWCANASIQAHCKALQRAVGDILKVTQLIQKEYPTVQVENLGETDFIIEYVQERKKRPVWEYTKVVLVCMMIFFGSAFSIMTFNADVSVDQVFGDLHRLMTGQERTAIASIRNAITWLEGGYAAGLFLGILIFYNHFRTKKRVMDPTPLEVEMREYERTVNQSILDQNERIKSKQKRRGERV